jgi:sec-independent protein translocase protein TatA
MPELILVLVIALLVLGPQRLPKVARNLGRGIREFKEAVTMDGDDYEARERERELETKTAPLETKTAPLETKTAPHADEAAEPAPKA